VASSWRWLTTVVGKSDVNGKEASAIGGFYSRRRVRGLAARPHVGIDGRHRGGLVAAAASGRACASPFPGSVKLSCTTLARGLNPIRFKPTFFFYSNLLRFVKYKTQSSLAPQIFKICMGLHLNILNNVLYWVNFNFSTRFML
jgi:hypothetical protein